MPDWRNVMSSAEERLKTLGLDLPPAPKAIGVYKPAVLHGGLCYTSGHGPLKTDGTLITGTVGDGFSVDDGYAAARQTGLAILATLRSTLGSLDRVKRVIKVFGMVQCTADFKKHPAVINGCSELFKDVFGEDCGVAARSAVGMVSLPVDMMVEIEAIFEIDV
jgi:enamine deaminase RidA (YjgF/YER057c/UK114 family)